MLTNFRDALELELQKKNNLRDIESFNSIIDPEDRDRVVREVHEAIA